MASEVLKHEKNCMFLNDFSPSQNAYNSLIQWMVASVAFRHFPIASFRSPMTSMISSAVDGRGWRVVQLFYYVNIVEFSPVATGMRKVHDTRCLQ
jgi:hypothetical protein